MTSSFTSLRPLQKVDLQGHGGSFSRAAPCSKKRRKMFSHGTPCPQTCERGRERERTSSTNIPLNLP